MHAFVQCDTMHMTLLRVKQEPDVPASPGRVTDRDICMHAIAICMHVI